MVIYSASVGRGAAADRFGPTSRQGIVAAVMAAIGLLSSQGVEAQTTLPVNGASGANVVTAAQSTTGGLVINQIFGVDYLVVGAGGGGGGGVGGGGGGGGFLESPAESPFAVQRQSYEILVGAGGAGGAASTTGASGQISRAFGPPASGGVRAFGGGGGGGESNAATSGGSGGGGAFGGSGVIGQGTNGGQGRASSGNFGNSGGGGAGQAGGTPTSNTGGNGGDGLASSITGTSVTYAGGGGGSLFNGGTAGSGGSGGGGNGGAGSDTSTNNGLPGTNGLGGGGGGGNARLLNGSPEFAAGGRGGNGIVILRYGGPVLPGLTTSVTVGSGTVTTTSYTAGGIDQQVYSFTNTIIDETTRADFTFDLSGVSEATLAARLGTTMEGEISGDDGLTFNGPGRLTLAANNTYLGATSVAAGGLIINGAHTGLGLASVASGARIGGTGSLAGALSIASGGLFVFNPADPTLDVSGAVTLDDSFGVTSLVNLDGTAIDWGSVANGTYTLIGSTPSTFGNIQNRSNDPYEIPESGGRTAYFTDGSLQLVVVPEPGTLLLAGAAAVACGWCRRLSRSSSRNRP